MSDHTLVITEPTIQTIMVDNAELITVVNDAITIITVGTQGPAGETISAADYVPYIDATASLDMGAFNITAENLYAGSTLYTDTIFPNGAAFITTGSAGDVSILTKSLVDVYGSDSVDAKNRTIYDTDGITPVGAWGGFSGYFVLYAGLATDLIHTEMGVASIDVLNKSLVGDWTAAKLGINTTPTAQLDILGIDGVVSQRIRAAVFNEAFNLVEWENAGETINTWIDTDAKFFANSPTLNNPIFTGDISTAGSVTAETAVYSPILGANGSNGFTGINIDVSEGFEQLTFKLNDNNVMVFDAATAKVTVVPDLYLESSNLYFYDIEVDGYGYIRLNDDEYFFYENDGLLGNIRAAQVRGTTTVLGDAILQCGTSTLYSNNSTGFTGFGIQAATAKVHAHSATNIATYHKTSNSVTGALSTDGFDVGVSATGVAELRQRENLAMEFYTNNTKHIDISSGGLVGIGAVATTAKLHVTSTTEQLRLSFDANNRCLFTVDGNGRLTMDMVGSSPSFIFNDVVGVGTGTTVSARLHTQATTEQFRVGYDASNYFSTTVGSTGGVTFNAVGAGAGFTFSDIIINTVPFQSANYTVATLPAGAAGRRAYVTDALAPVFGAAVAGGGAVGVPVYFDSAWKVG